jgi:hypothetical protein
LWEDWATDCQSGRNTRSGKDEDVVVHCCGCGK